MKLVSFALTLLLAAVKIDAQLVARTGVHRSDGTRHTRTLEAVPVNDLMTRELVKLVRDANVQTTTNDGGPFVQNVYPNSGDEVASDEREDCESDDDKMAVKIKIDLEGGGEDNAVYLVCEDGSDQQFVLSGPAMSLEKKKDYGSFDFCIDSDKTCNVDVTNIDGKGWDGELKVTITYKGDKIEWEPDSSDFTISWMTFSKEGAKDSQSSRKFKSRRL